MLDPLPHRLKHWFYRSFFTHNTGAHRFVVLFIRLRIVVVNPSRKEQSKTSLKVNVEVVTTSQFHSLSPCMLNWLVRTQQNLAVTVINLEILFNVTCLHWWETEEAIMTVCMHHWTVHWRTRPPPFPYWSTPGTHWTVRWSARPPLFPYRSTISSTPYTATEPTGWPSSV